MNTTLRIASPLIALLLLTAPASSALAQVDGYPCNGSPGERQVGVTPPQQGSIPLCMRDAAPQAQQQQPQPDRAALMSDAIIKAAKASAQGAELLSKDPVFQALSKGYWFYLEPNKGGASANAPCLATFAHITGMTSLMATGGPDQPFLAKFLGADIPKPKTQREVKVTYSSDAQRTLTLPAVNMAEPDSDLGAIVFGAGKDLDQAMSGMHDSEQITLKLDGKTIFTGLYRDGNEMKKRLSACVESNQK